MQGKDVIILLPCFVCQPSLQDYYLIFITINDHKYIEKYIDLHTHA